VRRSTRNSRREPSLIRRIEALALGLIVFGAGGGAAEPTLQWSPVGPRIDVAEQITLSVMLTDTVDVRTLDVTVQFDPAIVTSISGEPGALFDGFTTFPGFVEESADTWHGYCVILGADDWTTGPGELFRWTVEGLAEGTSLLVTVDLTLLPPGGGDFPDADLSMGVIRVGQLVAAPVAGPLVPRLDLYPNPFNPRTRLALTLPGGGGGRVEILDLRGQVVAIPWRGTAGEAPVRVDWNGTDQWGRALPSGVYCFRLLGDDGRSARCSGVLIR